MSIADPHNQTRLLGRERQIKAVSLELLARNGYRGFGMNDIAERIQWSKGTVYQHFANKEEILIAISNEAALKRISVCELAVKLCNRPREQMAAYGAATELFFERHAQVFQIELLLRIRSVRAKTSRERQEKRKTLRNRWLGIVNKVVRSAVELGDLELEADVTEADLVFGHWSLSVGGMTTIACPNLTFPVGVSDPFAALHRSNQRFLDGYGWKPLSSDFDFISLIEETKRKLVSLSRSPEFSDSPF